MAGTFPNFERGPEPKTYEEPNEVGQGIEALAGSTSSRASVISDLKAQVEAGELTPEEAFGIAVELGALPKPE